MRTRHNLEDSASFRAFARLPLAWSPKKSVLHQTISAIRAETWEAVNRAVLVSAQQDKLESGTTVRIDSTVTAALMHEPSDSALLWDAVRVMTRLLRQAAGLPGAPALQWRDRRRLAKKRARAIEYGRGKAKRRRLYRELIAANRRPPGPPPPAPWHGLAPQPPPSRRCTGRPLHNAPLPANHSAFFEL